MLVFQCLYQVAVFIQNQHDKTITYKRLIVINVKQQLYY